jgi:hypothetical protein
VTGAVVRLDAVLGHGQLPLSALTEVVSTWIDERITGPKG